MGDIPKPSVLYIHSVREYDCDDCPFWIAPTLRCVLHGANDQILPKATCGFWVPGLPGQFGDIPLGFVQKPESGYTERHGPCGTCVHWIRDGWDCERVSKDGPGDDPGMIHPDARCVLQQEAS